MTDEVEQALAVVSAELLPLRTELERRQAHEQAELAALTATHEQLLAREIELENETVKLDQRVTQLTFDRDRLTAAQLKLRDRLLASLFGVIGVGALAGVTLSWQRASPLILGTQVFCLVMGLVGGELIRRWRR